MIEIYVYTLLSTTRKTVLKKIQPEQQITCYVSYQLAVGEKYNNHRH